MLVLVDFLHWLKRQFFQWLPVDRIPVLREMRRKMIRLKSARPVQLPNGFVLKVDSIDSLGISWYKQYEVFETEILKRLVYAGDVAVDLGANIGYFTLHLSQSVGPNGTVHAFEPEPGTYQLLSENLSMNRVSNVRVNQVAVSDRNGEITLYLNPTHQGDHRVFQFDSGQPSVKIECQTLDAYFSQSQARVDFIKMDIQGAEYGAVLGMRRIIDMNNNLILLTEFEPRLLNENGVKPSDFLDLLIQQRLVLFQVDKANKNVFPVSPNTLLESYQREKWEHVYLVGSRNRSLIEQRLSAFLV
jgi:FkbM family methyltransferase